MDGITISEAKRMFAKGLLAKFRIDIAPVEEGWLVLLRDVKGTWTVLLGSRATGPRVFKTLGAVVSSLEVIGFRVVSLTHV